MTFDTSFLDETLARRRAAVEDERRALLACVQQLLGDLGPRFGIETAYIVGSLAAPDQFSERSDIDIAVEQVDAACYLDAIGEFSARLGREVDLIRLDRCHFAHRLREQGVKWTAASSQDESSL